MRHRVDAAQLKKTPTRPPQWDAPSSQDLTPQIRPPDPTPCLIRGTWENKPCSVNAAIWFPSVMPWPICTGLHGRHPVLRVPRAPLGPTAHHEQPRASAHRDQASDPERRRLPRPSQRAPPHHCGCSKDYCGLERTSLPGSHASRTEGGRQGSLTEASRSFLSLLHTTRDLTVVFAECGSWDNLTKLVNVLLMRHRVDAAQLKKTPTRPPQSHHPKTSHRKFGPLTQPPVLSGEHGRISHAASTRRSGSHR